MLKGHHFSMEVYERGTFLAKPVHGGGGRVTLKTL